jgi:hypothetical protein
MARQGRSHEPSCGQAAALLCPDGCAAPGRRLRRGVPVSAIPAQRVIFGTSGHRGSSLGDAFNEAHILAVTQAICLHRQAMGISGPLFLGRDTHALSGPALASQW